MEEQREGVRVEVAEVEEREEEVAKMEKKDDLLIEYKVQLIEEGVEGHKTLLGGPGALYGLLCGGEAQNDDSKLDFLS